MKKATRFLALLLCFVLAIGFLPPKARVASGTYCYEATILDAPGNGLVWSKTRIRIVVDTSSMKAKVSFERVEDKTKEADHWAYVKSDYPDYVSECNIVCANTYGFLTADVRKVSDKPSFKLTNFQWQTEPYIFCGGVVSREIQVKDKPACLSPIRASA